MSVQDYRVNAEVRRLLVSRWADVSQLQVGTTNGIVYVLGHLETTMEDPTRKPGEPRHHSHGERLLQLAMVLDKELRRVRDVRDVIFKLDNVIKRAGRWRSADGAAADRSPQRGALAALRPSAGRADLDAASDADKDSEGGMS